ncbi:MAG TPA: FAD-dependent oxidoreductase [Acetobacteraceae bacterium]|nr:FAD-dependent oxidoreductase [Acetobacteraceae bacterium]
MSYQPPRFAFRQPPELGAGGHGECRVAVVGGGLVGLTVALDLSRRGVGSVLLDDDDTVSVGSRAICFSKRTLEIYDRLGLGARMLAKGVTWNRGVVHFRDKIVYEFNLLPEAGHAFPAFVNLQQYYAEEWLAAACAETGLVDLRWKNAVTRVEPDGEAVRLEVQTPAGDYALRADWVLACDGAHSTVRRALGLGFVGKVFHDHFLIADVVMHRNDLPTLRRFWFEPPFHDGGSALMHRQADDVWRVDLQLGPDAEPERETEPARVRARLEAALGRSDFEIEWVSVYTFRCRRLERFRHGRVLFLGDSAHQVSPFGARGGNGGVQDADNLAWKLAGVLNGEAGVALLDSYDAERIPAADENILNSTRSTDFMTPKTEAARAYRDAVLELARTQAFARPMVNSGRLSRPAVLRGSPLNTPDEDAWQGGVPPGAPAEDAPVGAAGWLLPALADGGFTLLLFDAEPVELDDPGGGGVRAIRTVLIRSADAPGALWDREGLFARRYDARPGTAILFRPDQHVAARWRHAAPARILAARDRAMGGA